MPGQLKKNKKSEMLNKPSIVFFGGEPLGLPSLKALCNAGLKPALVVCNPDRPSGRGQQLQISPIKAWAEENGLTIFQPETFKERDQLTAITERDWDLFVVVAYNFILPRWFLEIPNHGVLNVHPSLLPKLRGASPIRSAILHNERDSIGVSVMLMDEKMDHGPILKQEVVSIADAQWPISGPELDDVLATLGGAMLAETIPVWLAGLLSPVEQEHDAATYTHKFTKADSELFLDPTTLPDKEAAFTMLCKIRAFAGMFDTYFVDNGKRIKIKEATLSQDGSLVLLRVTPEGKKETDFDSYLQLR